MSNRTSRKSKIIAIPFSEPEGLARAQMGDQEPRTEAEEMTELINEVKTEPEPVEEPLAIVDEIATKPKAKRAPRAKAKAPPPQEHHFPEVDPAEAEILAVFDEIENKCRLPNEVITERNVPDKVERPDCGKQMSAKTLKYSHAPNCTVKKNREQEHQTAPAISDEMIEHEVQKRLGNIREDRAARRQKAIQSLIANAF